MTTGADVRPAAPLAGSTVIAEVIAAGQPIHHHGARSFVPAWGRACPPELSPAGPISHSSYACDAGSLVRPLAMNTSASARCDITTVALAAGADSAPSSSSSRARRTAAIAASRCCSRGQPVLHRGHVQAEDGRCHCEYDHGGHRHPGQPRPRPGRSHQPPRPARCRRGGCHRQACARSTSGGNCLIPPAACRV